MNDYKLKELNKLKKQIDDLYDFIWHGTTVRIKLLGKTMTFKRMHTFGQAEYDVPKELYDDVMEVLAKHLVKLEKQFENGGEE